MSLESLRRALADRYRLERELGAGGMATVYLAHDLKHDRQVAIKVLRPELAAVIGAERFLAEIKTTANLQHPHILPLHDSGQADSFLYYVMPFVQGESLRDRLTRERQLSIPDAIRIATEVAGALDYAHRQGIIHRDIKPENILFHDGSALVADFGIALAASTAGTRMTETGMSLGTPHYMSPEQAMGERTLDARTDVYALGCVLYECLTGEPPFTGPTAQSIVAKVMTERPTMPSATRDTVPEGVEDAVLQALAKLPVDRFATAAGFAAALQSGGPRGTSPRSPARGHTPPGIPRLVRTLGVLLVVAIAAALWGWLRPDPAPAVSRQRVLLWEKIFPDFLNPSVLIQDRVAMAPDGSSIVFADSVGDDTQLFLKRRGEIRPVPMDGTEGAAGPFFSPDGEWIGYIGRGGKVMKVRVTGGGSIELAASGSEIYAIATWLDDGSVVFVNAASGLSRVPGSGGSTTVLRTLSNTVRRDDPSSLAPLPGSRGLLVTGCPGNCASGSAVYVYDIAADSMRLLVPDATGGWYSPTGHLLYTQRNGGLYAVGFDLTRMTVTSGAVSVAEGVAPSGFVLAANGDALLITGTEDLTRSRLVWVSREGRETEVDSAWTAAFEYPALSPDGQTIAVSVREEMTRIWIRRADGSRIRISSGDRGNWRPSWRPDGKAFAFVTTGGAASSNDIYLSPADGSTPPQLLVDSDQNFWEVELSRNGQWVVTRSDDSTSFGIFHARSLVGDSTPRLLLGDVNFNAQLSLSPDARWLAYTAGGISGKSEVIVASFPDMQVKYPVSQEGGTEPRWARSGRELFFKSRGKLVSLPIAAGLAFAPGRAKELFPVAKYSTAINHQQYDVSPDDQRFLMVRRPVRQGRQEVVLVEGFLRDFAERLKR